MQQRKCNFLKHTPTLQLERISTRQQIRSGTMAFWSNTVILFEVVGCMIITAVVSSVRTTNTIDEVATIPRMCLLPWKMCPIRKVLNT